MSPQVRSCDAQNPKLWRSDGTPSIAKGLKRNRSPTGELVLGLVLIDSDDQAHGRNTSLPARYTNWTVQ